MEEVRIGVSSDVQRGIPVLKHFSTGPCFSQQPDLLVKASKTAASQRSSFGTHTGSVRGGGRDEPLPLWSAIAKLELNVRLVRGENI